MRIWTGVGLLHSRLLFAHEFSWRSTTHAYMEGGTGGVPQGQRDASYLYVDWFERVANARLPAIIATICTIAL